MLHASGAPLGSSLDELNLSRPDLMRGRIVRAGEDAPQESVRMVQELTDVFRGLAQGIYVMPAFHRFDLAAEGIDHARSVAPAR